MSNRFQQAASKRKQSSVQSAQKDAPVRKDGCTHYPPGTWCQWCYPLDEQQRLAAKEFFNAQNRSKDHLS